MIFSLCGCSDKTLEEAKEAYSTENYSRVVDLLKNSEKNEAKEIYNLASAHISLENKDYENTIKV